MAACGWVQHDHRLMWRQSDVLSGGPIHPRVLALGQSRLLTAMCWDCVRVAGGQPWLSWRAGSASIAGIGTGLGDTLYRRPKFCAVFLCSAFCKQVVSMCNCSAWCMIARRVSKPNICRLRILHCLCQHGCEPEIFVFPWLSCVCMHLEMWAEVKVHSYHAPAQVCASSCMCCAQAAPLSKLQWL